MQTNKKFLIPTIFIYLFLVVSVTLSIFAKINFNIFMIQLNAILWILIFAFYIHYYFLSNRSYSSRWIKLSQFVIIILSIFLSLIVILTIMAFSLSVNPYIMFDIIFSFWIIFTIVTGSLVAIQSLIYLRTANKYTFK
ncbi:hypothetical protein [Mycoplasmopsis alligatoris]|uniref:hypothetical protein n=1 Tax=Mycoplasmopsis alligatoris TaxID=47687 RepID=UPI000590775A|nr:hypothetical protein [Mycoplasmopsis alligatoris]